MKAELTCLDSHCFHTYLGTVVVKGTESRDVRPFVCLLKDSTLAKMVDEIFRFRKDIQSQRSKLDNPPFSYFQNIAIGYMEAYSPKYFISADCSFKVRSIQS